jgi:hypothetical protein
MSGPAMRPPARVPTLTEVVDALAATPASNAASADGTPAADAAADGDVFDELQLQIDALLDERLRAVVVPAMQRLGEALIAELKGQMRAVLRDAAQRARADD